MVSGNGTPTLASLLEEEGVPDLSLTADSFVDGIVVVANSKSLFGNKHV